jgi:hypothetical protein
MKQSLKGLLTAIAGLMMFLPWTILILRQYEWALQSPAAEIMIGSYDIFGSIYICRVYEGEGAE